MLTEFKQFYKQKLKSQFLPIKLLKEIQNLIPTIFLITIFRFICSTVTTTQRKELVNSRFYSYPDSEKKMKLKRNRWFFLTEFKMLECIIFNVKISRLHKKRLNNYHKGINACGYASSGEIRKEDDERKLTMSKRRKRRYYSNQGCICFIQLRIQWAFLGYGQISNKFFWTSLALNKEDTYTFKMAVLCCAMFFFSKKIYCTYYVYFYIF